MNDSLSPNPPVLSGFDLAARLAIILLLFFAFFGTSLPFQSGPDEIDDITTANRINQIAYLLIFSTASIALLPKKREILVLIKTEKFLTIFLAWCLLSIAWSDFPFVSFKRWVQIFAIYLASLTFNLYMISYAEKLTYFKVILYPYLLISLFAVLLIPGAIDASFQTWRGLARTKNILGQISLMSIIITFLIWRFERTSGKRALGLAMLGISLILLLGTRSATATLTFLVLIGLAVLLFLNRQIKPAQAGYFLLGAILLGGVIIGVSAVYLAPDLITAIPAAFGKDITFSGRIDLWDYILQEARKHPLFGTGFQGFWVIENFNLLQLYEAFVWLPFQAHNGYLDLLNETGLFGIGLFGVMIGYYFINLTNLSVPQPWKWCVIAVLMINFQETTLFRPGNMTNVIFIFAYFTLYTDLIRPVLLSPVRG